MISDLLLLRDGFRWGLSTNLRLPDDEILYNLLEQFDLFVCSDLHESNIKPLVANETISDGIAKRISELRGVWFDLLKSERSIESIRGEDRRWARVFQLTDECWLYCCEQLAKLGIVEQRGTAMDDTRPEPIDSRFN